MRMTTMVLTGASALLLGLAGALPTAHAAEAAVPSTEVCSSGPSADPYACMKVARKSVPSGDTAVFTGTLSKKALANLKAWTKDDNIVCLTRFKTAPEVDGSWPGTTLDSACTTVRKDGGFTIEAEFGRKGRHFYGLEMGPCLADAGLCGNGDPGLIGVLNKGNASLVLRTT